MTSEREEVSIRGLLERIKGGDRAARKELFELLGDESEFGVVILAMARKLLVNNHKARRLVDTRDIVQSALCTGMSKFSDFRGNTESELFGWFRSILRTKVNRVVRRKERDVLDHVGAKEAARQDCAPSLPLSSVIDQELLEILHAAIKDLPPAQRLVVELRLRGVNAPEIGRMLDLQPATVRKRESRAVERLKELVH